MSTPADRDRPGRLLERKTISGLQSLLHQRNARIEIIPSEYLMYWFKASGATAPLGTAPAPGNEIA